MINRIARLTPSLGRRFAKGKDSRQGEKLNPNNDLVSPSSIPALQALRRELANRRQLLPKIDQKLTVFLEVEGVLFHTWVPHKTEAYFNKPYRNSDFEFEATIGDEEVPVLLYLRPGWQQFLSFLKANCETVLYTSLQEEYWQKVSEIIGQGRFSLFRGTYFQEDCGILSSEYDGFEELSKLIEGLGRQPARSVLVDHHPFAFIPQPSNVIPIEEYNPANDRQMTDNHLFDVISTLESLLPLPDVRAHLRERFGLETMVEEFNFK